jgi:hypothetical protein
MYAASTIRVQLQYVPLKGQPTSTRLHGAIYQKAVFFTFFAVRK